MTGLSKAKSFAIARQPVRGVVLVLSLVFLAVFAAIGLALGAATSLSLQTAVNHKASNRARAAAESGLDVLRYWLNAVSISGKTDKDQYLYAVFYALGSVLRAESITSICPAYESERIHIPSIVIDPSSHQTFKASISMTEPNILQLDVIGSCKDVQKAVRLQYRLCAQGNTVFDFGLATKGPLLINGNVDLDGANVNIESNVYIESLCVADGFNDLELIGNCSVAGDIKIVNSSPTIVIGNAARVGGEKGDKAWKHIQVGVPPCDFPVPDPSIFEGYVTSVIDSGTNTLDGIWTNVRIIANSNPKFPANVQLLGVVFIETPNVVEFTGNVTIRGIIVGNGDVDDDSAVNKLIFKGNVECYSVADLSEQFGDLRTKIGTFILAPGFEVDFRGNFETQAGAIAANGVKFSGNAGGTIRGSVINYSRQPAELSGNTDLSFNRSGTQSAPAGFVPSLRLVCDPLSYTEPVS